MGEGTAAARAAVLRARAVAEEELGRLEASARHAMDIPGRVRANPLPAAAVAAGVGFLVVGGPARVLGGLRRILFGPREPLPASLLPDEVDRALRKLGPDGAKVRGALERDFARYLEERAPERKGNALKALLLTGLAKPLAARYGRRLAESLLAPPLPRETPPGPGAPAAPAGKDARDRRW